MKIYFAGNPAGYDGFDVFNRKELEKLLCEELRITNRLCSFYYDVVINGYLEFRKEHERIFHQERHLPKEEDTKE